MKKIAKLADGRKLYRIEWQVRPSEDHPLFGKSAAGALSIWVFERSPGAAGVRAMSLLEVMPFLTTSKVAESVTNIVPPHEAYRILVDMVELTGFSAYYDSREETARREVSPVVA
ncbi:MAG: hypothetical protein H0X40_03020 [Chthoniobacterales bacterium]|nr:hypothetical protein [Chthoniobacterales bacterium]